MTDGSFALPLGRAIERVARYGLTTEICDVEDPNTGDLDGIRILVEQNLGHEDRLFIVLHLFGHCVQWNSSADAREVGQATFLPKTDAEFAAVFEYEKDASRYGLQLLHEAGVTDLDRWLTDLWHADWKYLEHFYRTGEKKDPRSFLRPGVAPLLTPLAVPPFTPAAWPRRFAI